MAEVFLSLGSNVGERRDNILAALAFIDRKGVRLKAVSSLYESAPVGVTGHPDFLNICVAAETVLEPEALLNALQDVEAELGRERTAEKTPRIIDIDILLYGHIIFESERLVIPHREMHKRRFVLEPLKEIAGDAAHPALKKSVNELAREAVSGEIRKIGAV